MKEIQLTKGKVALVDDADFEYLNQFKWHAGKFKGDIFYACRKHYNEGKIKAILMHREIMQTLKGMDTDHIDHNGLNNQKSNLRVCSHKLNLRNTVKHMDGSSQYKGVSIKTVGKNKYYRGRIYLNGKDVVKHFPHTPEGEIMAARFYNEQAIKHFGEFAHLNFGQ